MAYCELLGGPKGYDGATVQAGASLSVFEVRSTVGTIIYKQKKTYQLKGDGTWSPPLRIERGAVAYIAMQAPGYDGDMQHGTPMAIPDAATAELKSISAAVSIPQQVPIAIPPNITGDFLKLEE
jgi:hypothetical protein